MEMLHQIPLSASGVAVSASAIGIRSRFKVIPVMEGGIVLP